jgi:hypothetical protein
MSIMTRQTSKENIQRIFGESFIEYVKEHFLFDGDEEYAEDWVNKLCEAMVGIFIDEGSQRKY